MQSKPPGNRTSLTYKHSPQEAFRQLRHPRLRPSPLDLTDAPDMVDQEEPCMQSRENIHPALQGICGGHALEKGQGMAASHLFSGLGSGLNLMCCLLCPGGTTKLPAAGSEATAARPTMCDTWPLSWSMLLHESSATSHVIVQAWPARQGAASAASLNRSFQV